MQTLQSVASTRFGALDAPPAARYRLLRPLAGFPATGTLIRVALAHQAPFVWLQSAEEPAVAFAAAPADLLREGYRVELPPWDHGLWSAARGSETLVLLSFKGAPSANLAAPVLLDPSRRVALQVLNPAGGWGVSEPLERPRPPC
jgi:flagellar assembly factor FliW